jgi:hypothetical protein
VGKTAKEIVDNFGEHRDELKNAVDEMKCIECRDTLKMLIDSVVTTLSGETNLHSIVIWKNDMRRIVLKMLRADAQ